MLKKPFRHWLDSPTARLAAQQPVEHRPTINMFIKNHTARADFTPERIHANAAARLAKWDANPRAYARAYQNMKYWRDDPTYDITLKGKPPQLTLDELFA